MLGLAFVMSQRQNHFFVDLVIALRYELDRMGIASFVSTNGFPMLRDGLVYVLLPPHEYFTLEGGLPGREVLARTIFICAEQPATPHFEHNAQLCPAAGAVFDISALSIRELQRRGVHARHFELGYSRYWDRGGLQDKRDTDITFIGSASPRRVAFLASYSEVLSRHQTRLIISDNSAPNHSAAANFLIGDDKLSLLRRSKVLVNLHQGSYPYFEWPRIIECVHSGCVVVSEHSTDIDPLKPGIHFISGRPESLALLAEELVEKEAVRVSIQQDALACLKRTRTLEASLGDLVEVAQRLSQGHTGARRTWTAPAWANQPTPIPKLGEPATPEVLADPPMATELSIVRQALKDVRLELLDVRRELSHARISAVEGRGGTMLRKIWESASYGSHPPRVSIISAVYNHAPFITEALQSVMDSDYSNLECVVVDDGSSDGSSDAVVDWSRDNEALPVLLLRHPVNRGLAAARNNALDFARGEFVFVLDADNKLLPRGLRGLVGALEDDEGASSFCYGMIACVGDEGYQGLLSHLPWDPARLRHGNYIDAMALFRTESLRAMGGYTADRRLYGWEDYDLYCRIADQDQRGVFVPEIVGLYRVSPTSMLSLTNVSTRGAFAALRERYPRLMHGIALPN